MAATADTQKLHRHLFICFHGHIFIYVRPQCQRLSITSNKHCFITRGVSFFRGLGVGEQPLCNARTYSDQFCGMSFPPSLKTNVREQENIPEIGI